MTRAISHLVYPISRGVILRRSEAEPKDLLSGAGAKQILRFAQDDTSMNIAEDFRMTIEKLIGRTSGTRP
jgi:hypothetical protein